MSLPLIATEYAMRVNEGLSSLNAAHSDKIGTLNGSSEGLSAPE
jgi:hypothetical protein